MRFSLFFLFNLFIFNQVISQITTDNAAPFDTPEFLVDSENRINKLWELCIYTPMDLETKNYILNQNDIFKRYETLLNYVESVLNS